MLRPPVREQFHGVGDHRQSGRVLGQQPRYRGHGQIPYMGADEDQVVDTREIHDVRPVAERLETVQPDDHTGGARIDQGHEGRAERAPVDEDRVGPVEVGSQRLLDLPPVGGLAPHGTRHDPPQPLGQGARSGSAARSRVRTSTSGCRSYQSVMSGRKFALARLTMSSRSGRSAGGGAAGSVRPRGFVTARRARLRCSAAVKPRGSSASGEVSPSRWGTRWNASISALAADAVAAALFPCFDSASAQASSAA